MTSAALPLKIGATIGILGGGQLGRMLALAGAELGFDVHIFEPEADCPAGRVSARCVNASWDNLAALTDFAANVDVITYEFENVPIHSLAHVAALKPVRPGIRSLDLTQDRLVEKAFINNLGIATAPFVPILSQEDANVASVQFNFPAILKTNRFGYDGKGQIRLNSGNELAAAWAELGYSACVLEGFVDFEREISVVLARAESGDVKAFDCTHNIHKAGILHTSSVPSGASSLIEANAIQAASEIVSALDHVGILAVEFFVMRDGALAVNEIAPRVHNSGHWTQDGCITSQFSQHIRAVALWPLAETKRHSKKVVMQT